MVSDWALPYAYGGALLYGAAAPVEDKEEQYCAATLRDRPSFSLFRLDRNMWTPPVEAKSVMELVREDRD